MKWRKQRWVWLAATVFSTVACVEVSADTRGNPYDPIVERNPFGLKPPPPPDPDAGKPPPPPSAPLAAVELTGILNVGPLRALLEIVPGPGKPMIKPVLQEGERVESVEVVSINIEKNQVVIKNGNITTNLTFKVAKSAPPAAAPPGAVPPPVIPGAVPQPPQTSYNQNYGGSGRNNVMVAGGSSTPAAAANPNANGPTLGGGTTDAGFRSIPSRKILSNAATPQGVPQMSPEEQVLNIELNRKLNDASGRVLPPLPPTPLTSTEDLQRIQMNPGYQDNSGYQPAPQGTTGRRPGWVPRNLPAPPIPGQPQ